VKQYALLLSYLGMTLKQLRYLTEIVRQGLHLSQAAEALHTSQPGVSRQIQLLEKELGVTIFQRHRNRILGVTQAGKEILRFAQRMLRDAESVRNVGLEMKEETRGHLVIATNHTHARYTLPRVITAFSKAYPMVRLEFWQGIPSEAFRWLDAGEVDIALGRESGVLLENVLLLPCAKFHRILVVPASHPLLRIARPGLEDIAKYPIITHGFRSDGRWTFRRAFEERHLRPNILFSSIDADVSKAYVELGLGVAILPHITFDTARDTNLRAIDLRHLFPSETMCVGVNKQQFYRHYVFKFLEALAPELTRRRVERLLSTAS
jgi:LysR family transcriptional regulator, cys regulon transcriptional activator